MDAILKMHPCLVVVAAWAIGIPIRVAGISELALLGDILFVLGVITAIALIVQRRRRKRGPAVYCHQCGKPYPSEKEMEEHALSH